MHSVHRQALQTEITLAKTFLRQDRYDRAMHHLERAHVLGQRFVVPHVHVHWLMLRVEVARKRPLAAFGQLVRIALGALGSAVGVVPIGNTGGSDVGMFRRMPIDPELARIMAGGGDGDVRAVTPH